MGRKKAVENKDIELRLTDLEMKDLKLFEVRREMQRQVLKNLDQEQRLLSIEYKQRMSEIRSKIMSTKSSEMAIVKEHNEFVASVEKRLNIKLADYTYNETGELRYNPIPEGTQNPPAPADAE